MKILNLKKIILLSTILLPFFIASAGLFDKINEKKTLNTWREDCNKKFEKSCYSLIKKLSENPSPESQKEAMDWTTHCCDFGGTTCCSELVKKGDYKAALKGADKTNDQLIKKDLLEKACKGEELEGCERLCSFDYLADHQRVEGCLKAAEIVGKNNPSVEPSDKQITLWATACNLESYYGCTMAGVYTKHRPSSLIYLKKACNAVYVSGCYYLGDKAREESDIKGAENYYRMACEKKFEDSCEILNEIQKEIQEISNQKAAKLEPVLSKLKAECDKGNLNSCIQHGLTMIAPADQKNPWFKKACDGGLMEGCFQMGRGFLELKNLDGAMNLFVRACNGGHLQGCYEAGFQSFKRNKPADTKKYLLLACNGGHPVGCNTLGTQEANKGNKAEAAKFYAMACDGGNTSGCNNLASLQIDWNNITDARKYLNEACNAGSNAACQKLTALTKQGM
jgi:TPR repeat protein